jgi:GNAT superfamily N-acetyltransferase
LAVLGEIEISADLARLRMPAVMRLLRGAYWSANRPQDVAERSLRNSLTFGAYNGDELVGLTRVVTDYATFAWLCDVIVDERYRGRGIGKALVEAALAHPGLHGMRRWILATRDAHGLYARYGFTELAGPERWLEKYDPAR